MYVSFLVNLPNDEESFHTIIDEPIPEAWDRITKEHPDWTSVVITVVRKSKRTNPFLPRSDQ